MKITAAVAREGKDFSVEEVELDDPRADEVVVRVVATGMCHTDLVSRDGALPTPLPAVFGHEGAGVIERVGAEVTRLAPGDHVVMGFASCAACPQCRTGRPAYCAEGVRYTFGGARPDGSPTLRQNGQPVSGHYFGQSSFATHALAHERSVVKVPTDLPLELLGPLGCGVMTGAGAVLNALRPAPGSRLAVFGTGAVGLSAVMAARLTGASTIIAVDGNPGRLALALELGATHALNRHEVDPVTAVQEITDGAGVDYSLEATGVTAIMRQAFEALTRVGVCGIMGVPAGDAEVTLNGFALLLGRTIRGIVWGDSVPAQFIPALVELHRLGRLPIEKLMTIYPLDEINRAAADSLAGRIVKPVVRMPQLD